MCMKSFTDPYWHHFFLFGIQYFLALSSRYYKLASRHQIYLFSIPPTVSDMMPEYDFPRSCLTCRDRVDVFCSGTSIRVGTFGKKGSC